MNVKSDKKPEPTPDISAWRSPHLYPAAVIVFILAVMVSVTIVWRTEQNRLQLERARVSDVAGDYAHTIQANIERTLSAAYALAAMVRQGKGSIPDFDAVAGEMLPFYPGAASLQLAPDGIVRRIVPLEGNEGAIGHNLLKDPARTKEAFLARDTGKLTLAGPFTLVQGGVGAAGRLPVFLDNGMGKNLFWGFTIVLIRFPNVLDPTHLSSLEKRGFRYELWRIHPDTGKRQVISASSQAPLINPVERTLEVPNGTWTLSVAPVNGWGDPLGLTLKASLGLLFSLLLFVLTHSLINTNIRAARIAKNLTAELLASEEKYKTLIESANDAVFIHEIRDNGMPGPFLEVNELACRQLGYSKEELSKLGPMELDDPRYRDRIEEAMKLLLKDGQAVFETAQIAKDGRSIPVEVSCRVVEIGGQRLLFSLVRDITDRKQAEKALRLSQLIIDKASIGIIQGNSDAKILSANDHWARVLGYSQEELRTMSFFDIDPNLTPGSWLKHRELLTSRGFNTIESVNRRKDGSTFPVEVTVNYFKFNEQVFSCSFIRDITERKSAEEQLQANLRFFESMDRINRAIQGTNDIEQMMSDILDIMLSIFGCDRAFLAVPCDPTMSEFTISIERTSPQYPGAFARGETVPMSPAVRNLFHELLSNPAPNEIYIGKGLDPDDAVWKTYDIKSQLAIALYPKVGPPWECGLHQCSYNRVWTPQEKKLFLEISRRLADGLTSLLSHRDLKESEARYRRIVDTANEGIWMLGADLLTMFVNARMAQMIGYTDAEIIGRPLTDFMFKEDAPDHHRRMEKRRQGISEHYELRFCHKNGEAVWTQVSAVPVMNDRQSFEGTFAMFTNITERKRAEAALLQTNNELAAIYDNAPLMMMLIDSDRRVLKANRAVLQNAGRNMEDIIGLRGGDILKCLHALDDPNGCGFGPHCASCGLRDAIATALRTKQSIYRKEASILIDREAPLPLHVLVSTVLLELHEQSVVLVCIEDVTERIKLEKQLLQAQKMEAIGTLAGGIAHDFNNILTAIIGFGGLLKRRLDQDSAARKYVDDILAASERASKLTHSLLTFSRKQIITFSPLDLNEIVKRFEMFISRIIGEDIELRVMLTEECLTVMADSGQIEQVLMNLATNARDAMQGGGILTVKTERIHVSEGLAGLSIMPGDYAIISISDTGEGMSEETRQRIFEPFFTTKEVGKGTGLGMSIVYGIIKQHDGEINVYSEIGTGTTFKIYLRLVDASAERVSAAQASAPKRGSETILVAEDDDQVRRLCKTILEGYGYTVIEAVNGEDAVTRFIENKDKIQLLLLDVIMPRMSGKEAYEKIKKMAQGIRVIFSSGYTADIILQKGLLEDGLTLILKPVNPDMLLAKVREVLDK